jgi:predicted amidohydrolase
MLAGSCRNVYESAPPAITRPHTPAALPGEVRVAGIVLKWIRGEKEANFERAEALIRRAADGGADLVVTSECFLDGYAAEDRSATREQLLALAEPVPEGEYYARLARLADELDVHLVAGLLERDGTRTFNTAVMIGPDGALIGRYHKQELLWEEAVNTAGTASTVFDTELGRIGAPICSDRTDRRVMRAFRDAGAQLLVCLSGGGFGPRYNDGLVARRSRETGLPIVFVHPCEFLVALPDGTLAYRALLGDDRNVGTDDVGGDGDSSGVFFVDLALEEP